MKKKKLLTNIRRNKKVKLNLGCGESWEKQYPDYDGLDIIDFGQKYVGDVIKLLPDLYGGTFDEVISNHFLEHFDQDQLKLIFSGVHRVLKDGAIFKVCVPHKDKEQSWVLSHKTFWTEYTFRVLENELFDRYGFGGWKISKLVTNERLDIHCWLKKI